jgi:hypothetical protein
MKKTNVTLSRVEDQIEWYSLKSIKNQYWFKGLKILEFISACLIPLFSGLGFSPWVVGGLGSLIVILEGVQQLCQFQNNWNTYRTTCEELKHEKFLYLAKAGPYLKGKGLDSLFAERAETLISREHAKWVSAQKAVSKAKVKGS